ncbi:MAG: hypothetical protein AB7G21_00945 [Dehalococcoidia bacterium]
MPDVRAVAMEVGWVLAYAVPWLGALLFGGWAWRRLRPHSLFLAWAGATPIALASLLVLSVLLVSVIDAAFPPVR